MKQHLICCLALLALGFTACGPVYVIRQDPPPAGPPSGDPEDLTYQSFYDQLSPYGQWVDDPEYGYVWQPDAGPDFRPYATNGQWVYTDDGWTWDSGYPWGWAAFHYGRWSFRDGAGWLWVPGSEWAPAWVSWRSSDDYYGWAPLGPSVSFDMAYGGGYNPPPNYWCFVPHQYIGSPQIGNYYVRPANNVTIINRTVVINKGVYNSPGNNRFRNGGYRGGPDPGEVGRFSGAPVRPIPIRDSRAPGERMENGNLSIYRPRVREASPRDARPRNIRPATPPVGNNSRPPASSGQPNPSAGQPPISPERPGRPSQATPGVTPGQQQPNFNRPPENRPPSNQPGNQPVGRPVNQPPAGQPANQGPAGQQPGNPPGNRRPGTPYNGPQGRPVTTPGAPANAPGQQPLQPFRNTPVRTYNPPVARPATNNQPPAANPGQQRPVVLPSRSAQPPAPRQTPPPTPPKKEGPAR